MRDRKAIETDIAAAEAALKAVPAGGPTAAGLPRDLYEPAQRLAALRRELAELPAPSPAPSPAPAPQAAPTPTPAPTKGVTPNA